MSDLEESDIESFEIDDVISSDDEEIIVQELPSDDVVVLQSNKFRTKVEENMKYPSKFLAHALIMHRVKSLFHDATPLCSNPPQPGSGDYNQVFRTIVDIAVKEVMEDKSCMMFYNPKTKTEWSANSLDKDIFRKHIQDAIELSED